MRILFTGGGSGGHITPIVAVIRELKIIAEKEQILDLEFFYAGPNDPFGKEMLKEEDVFFIPVMSGKLRNYFSLRNILDAFKVGFGVVQALWNIFLLMPDVIFSKGGYGSLPSVIAAIVFRIPLIVHDSDSIPGRANRFAGRFAQRVGIAFPAAVDYFAPEKTAMVGVPVRKRILGGNKSEAKDNLSVFSQLPVVGVMGASQGSQKINEALSGAIQELVKNYEVVHQTGTQNFEEIKGEIGVILGLTDFERYHPFGFMDEGKMRDFYAASDLIVSRAGATSIYEIAAWGKPSILIPLKIAAQNHQRDNAYQYANHGAAVIIEEENLSPHILLAEIKKIMQNPEKLKKMSAEAQRFARIDSANVIAREILKLGIH